MHWWRPGTFFVIRPGFFCHQTWGRLLSQTKVPKKNLGSSHLLVFLPSFWTKRQQGLYVQFYSVPREHTGEGVATQRAISRAGVGFSAEMKLSGKKPIRQKQSTSQIYIDYYNYHKQETNQTNKKSKIDSYQLPSGKPGFPRSAAVPNAIYRVGTAGFLGSCLHVWCWCSTPCGLAVAPEISFPALGAEEP